MSVTIILVYLLVGAVAGILAGLLGIGGGLVIVPMLVLCFTVLGIAPVHLMHLALGTSMACIIFTAVSSSLAHHRKGAVNWPIVKRISMGIIVGTFAGAWLASRLSTGFLKGFFVIFLYYVAFQLILDKQPPASRDFPKGTGMLSAGGLIGIVSSLVGIGGGSLSVPFMMWCNMPVRNAIATASAIGFPLAVAGTLGYVINGYHAASLPPFSIGFVYLPALVGIVTASVLTAPFGAKLAHSLPIPLLKKIFAFLLLVLATKMAWGLFR